MCYLDISVFKFILFDILVVLLLFIWNGERLFLWRPGLIPKNMLSFTSQTQLQVSMCLGPIFKNRLHRQNNLCIPWQAECFYRESS